MLTTVSQIGMRFATLDENCFLTILVDAFVTGANKPLKYQFGRSFNSIMQK